MHCRPQSCQDACSHRGPVEIQAVSPEKRRDLSARFQERNGVEWRVEEVGQFDSYVRIATRFVDVSAVGPAVVVPADQAKEMALDLVRKNADLFGLSASELASLSVHPRPDLGGRLSQWSVHVSGKLPRAGYEKFASVAKDVRLVVMIQRDGVVRAVVNSYDYLPPFELCTDPLLAAEDPKIRAGVLGKQLSYSNIAGQPVFAGKVEPGDIQSTILTIYVDRKEASATVHLAYELRVEKDRLPWFFVVDADTGTLLAVREGFMT